MQCFVYSPLHVCLRVKHERFCISTVYYRGRVVPCHFAFLISIFQLPFSTLHSIFHITTSIFHFPTSKADPVAFTGHLQAAAGCRPIMRSYSVRGIYKPGDQPTLYSVVIYRADRGRPTVRSSIFQFPISNGTLRHLQARWLTDYARCKCLIIRTLRLVGQPPSL